MLFFVLQSCEQKPHDISDDKNRKAEIDRLSDIGDKYFEKSQYDSSFYYFNKAQILCDVKKDLPKFIYSLSNMATIQQRQGDFSGSESTISAALPYLKPTTKVNCQWNIYTILGNNYMYTADYNSALYYFNKGLKLKTKGLLKAGIQNNIALIYIETEDYQKAIKLLYPLTLQKDVQRNPEYFSRVLDNIGYCYYKTGNSNALDYLNKSLRIREQNNDSWGLIASHIHLFHFYSKSNPRIATEYILKAYSQATKFKSVDERLYCLEHLIQISTGNTAKKYSLQYLHINDSIKKVRQQAKNQFAKIKYDFKKEKDENLALKTQKALILEKQNSRNQLFSFVIAFTVLTSIFATSFLMAKNKREQVNSSYQTEIRIAKQLHDELANDVYQTMTFAETQDLSTSQNKETLLSTLDLIYSRTRNFSKENSVIDTGTQFTANLKEMMSGFNTDTNHVIINGLDAVNWPKIEKTKKITFYRVVQELLVNMKKHSKSSLAVLSFKINDNIITVDYTDNGVGFPFDKLNLKNGLHNVENRIHAIKGTVTFDTKSNKGFKVKITFPI